MYRAFAHAVGADLGEVELALGEYATFGDFFARGLRPGARPIATGERAIAAPCDGVVAAAGSIIGGALLQAKGIDYQLADLLASDVEAERFAGGSYATIYLAPRDYHRVHAPLGGRIVAYDYVPGALWPVNPRVAARRRGLFTRNERVVIWIERSSAAGAGRIAVVMVGATGVGNIRLRHAPDSVTWRRAREHRRIELDEPVRRGDELGAFRLGSTVVLAFEPGAAQLDAAIGTTVRAGEALGEVAP